MSQIKTTFRKATTRQQKLFLMSLASWIQTKYRKEIDKAPPMLKTLYGSLRLAPGAKGCYMDLESSWRKYCRMYKPGDPLRWFMFAVIGSLRNEPRELLHCYNIFRKETALDIHEGVVQLLWDDSYTDVDKYTSKYSPTMQAAAMKFYTECGKDLLDVHVLADQMEDEGLPEAAHFRSGVHTIACPVLLKVIGK